METINKVQINGQIKTDSLGNVLERSTLLNIRTDDVAEAVQLFNQLRSNMDGQEKLNPAPEPAQITAGDLFPDSDEEESKACNWPFGSDGPAPQCPDCSSQMVKRNGKNGEFWGCSRYSKGCRGTRQV